MVGRESLRGRWDDKEQDCRVEAHGRTLTPTASINGQDSHQLKGRLSLSIAPPGPAVGAEMVR